MSVLAVGEDREPAQSWITRHADELRILTPHLAWIAPNVAASALRRGITLPLGLSHGLDWLDAAAALDSVGQINRELACAVVAANRSEIIQGLHLPQPNSCEKLTVFCEVLEGLMPGELESMLTELDAAKIERSWQARLRGRAEERKAARFLLSAAARGSGPVASVAQRLLAGRRTRQPSRLPRT